MTSAAFDPATAAPAERLIEFPDNMLLIDLCGGFDRNLATIEAGFDIAIARRGNQLALHGPAENTEGAEAALRALYDKLEAGNPIDKGDVDAAIRERFKIHLGPVG